MNIIFHGIERKQQQQQQQQNMYKKLYMLGGGHWICFYFFIFFFTFLLKRRKTKERKRFKFGARSGHKTELVLGGWNVKLLFAWKTFHLFHLAFDSFLFFLFASTHNAQNTAEPKYMYIDFLHPPGPVC